MTHDTTPLLREETASTPAQTPLSEETIEGQTEANGVNHSTLVPKPTTEYPVADFYESITYGWTEEGFEVRQALKKFSEHTDADY